MKRPLRLAVGKDFEAAKSAWAGVNACIKCRNRLALEFHHVNGPEDNDPVNVRPLCFWCHGIAPMGAAYWEWERSGESGIDRLKRQIAVEFPHATGIHDFEAVLLAVVGYFDTARLRKISDGVKSGLGTARRAGKVLGRPRVVFRRDEAERLRAEGLSWRQVSERLGVKVTTLRDALAKGAE